MKLYRAITLMLALILVLAACTLPSARATEQVNPDAVFTAAAQTVEAQLTQNALLNPTTSPATEMPPTDTPPAVTDTPLTLNPVSTAPTANAMGTATPGSGPIPTAACDSAQFVTDVSIPDGTSFTAGTSFTKTWRLKNTGTCTWNSSYALIYDSGDLMGGPNTQTLTGSVTPSQTVDISVNLQAPSKDGTYRGYWGLVNSSGARIPVAGGTNSKSFYVEIIVGTGGTTVGTETAGKFAVTSIGFSVYRNGACGSSTGKYVVNATVTANKAGDVTYTWIRSDDATGPDMSGTLSFSEAGSKTISFEWYTSVSGLWVEIYIDKPNHQQFGRANLSCP